MTFKERQRRLDSKKVQQDFDELEDSFIKSARKLNEKRRALLVKRIEKLLPELREAYKNVNHEEVDGILSTIELPSRKEYGKLIRKLIYSSMDAGILRAHFDLLRLRELYEFSENEDTWEVVEEGYDYKVVYPEKAKKFLDKYSLQITVITEDTVKDRIRSELRRGLEEGLSNRELIANIRETAGTWMSDWHAETIARTESGKMYNAGRVARYMEPSNNGFVEALQYDAIVDKRTTKLCKTLDGMIVSIQKQDIISEYTPPNHFQCRSTWIAITKYEEWEDDFDPDGLEPEKGFEFEAPMSGLLNGDEPLVQPKKKPQSLLTLDDPELIRNLTDDQFKTAIGNITDQALKLSLIKERAEQMLVKDNGLKEKEVDTEFLYYGINDGSGEFEIFGDLYRFYVPPEIREEVDKLMKAFEDADNSGDNNNLKNMIEEFGEKHGSNPMYSSLLSCLRDGISRIPKEAEWDGLNPVKNRSERSKRLLTIKEPPKTANYKNADRLRLALELGQAWLLKYADEKLSPESGIKMRFKNNLTRAYATGDNGEIHFGKSERDPGVIVHESAHVIHWNNKTVADLISEFYLQRTEGDKMTKYHGENTKRDDFYNPYVGRVYGWEHKFENGKRATHSFLGQEVLSMGMQALQTDPMRFYKIDKEHFLLTYAILRGLF